MKPQHRHPPLVIIESPYAGDVEANLDYARRCMADSLKRGEAPFASHLLYTQPGVLVDAIPSERTRGVEAGYAWGEFADIHAFYLDRGMSRGMQEAFTRAIKNHLTIEVRYLEPEKEGVVAEALKSKYMLRDYTNKSFWVRSDIDSSGMSVYFVSDPAFADRFDSRHDAERFHSRCGEPESALRNWTLEIVEVSDDDRPKD